MSYKVYVVDYGRKYLAMRWVDDTGKTRHKSSKCTRRREAERVAAAWEQQLNSAEISDDGAMLWHTFVDRYTVEHLAGLAPNSRAISVLTLKQLEDVLHPLTLRDVTSQGINRFVASRRSGGAAEATIKKDLTQIRAALRWAVASKYLRFCPTIPKINRSHRSAEMKGRPLTDAEFAAMVSAVESVVGNYAAASWERLLRGLWLSGLRIGEAIALRWERGPWPSVDIADPSRPIMVISGGRQKSGIEQRLPLTPDFGQFLAEDDDREGYVFRQFGLRGWHIRSLSSVVHIISEIGEASGVIIDESRGSHPTAHDLRRSFGSRWSTLVMPAVLKELMRHSSIETTMRFYVGASIARTHDAIHAAIGADHGSNLGSTD